MPFPAPLLVIRHGETDWNASGRLQGRQDIPLNARGRAQAEAVGLALRERLDVSRFTCLSSPLQRASETLDLILAQLPGAPLSLGRDARLAEKAFGDWEGLDMPTIAQRYPEQHARRMAEPYTFRVPGGESYADAAERVRPLLVAIGLASPEVATRMVIHQGRWLELDAAGYAWYSAPGWDAQP
ncbi:histidine phosphatase family protein [Pseudomonas oryzihabitans]|uniref:histidine phosphatase family protein n=1 Tax=Pseudomonas oryzihabitans TaxID=47885 RepID=UPI0028A939E5|nr:histidine phosphatase family protein [Pseudomonas oryzihabitans]